MFATLRKPLLLFALRGWSNETSHEAPYSPQTHRNLLPLDFVQSPIERMPRSFRQIVAIPRLLLPLTLSTRSHRHGQNPTLRSSSRQSD